jgi:CopG family nickel-responsive transcriptional regulator
MQRVTITLTDEIADEIDRFMSASGARNRSEAIRELVRQALSARPDAPVGADCLGVMVFTIDQTNRSLAARVPQRRLDRHDTHLTALSIPLDHTTSLEVSVVRGTAGDVRHEADSLFAERGVMHGSLALVPVAEAGPRHAHGDGDQHDHAHLRVQATF